MRLHTGHNRLNAHMFRKMKLAPSPTCNCGLEDQTAEKILQRCPLLQTARTSVWPTVRNRDAERTFSVRNHNSEGAFSVRNRDAERTFTVGNRNAERTFSVRNRLAERTSVGNHKAERTSVRNHNAERTSVRNHNAERTFFVRNHKAERTFFVRNHNAERTFFVRDHNAERTFFVRNHSAEKDLLFSQGLVQQAKQIPSPCIKHTLGNSMISHPQPLQLDPSSKPRRSLEVRPPRPFFFF